MLFYSFFKSLVGKDVVVELKNDLSICGTLHSVDQYLNIKASRHYAVAEVLGTKNVGEETIFCALGQEYR
jgi:U6 snRNA-associated Sm-like protein LSm2